jgi:uncharacterized protein GlcG (DUF336 family)
MELTVAKKDVSHEAAHLAVKAAVEKGLEIGCKMNAAVVDQGGNLSAFLRAEGAFLHSISIAEDKAYTSVSFGVGTLELFKMIETAPILREGLVHRERLIIFGGGFPIVVDGQTVGGIGVSGGSEEEDEICSRAGLAAIGLTYDGAS